MGGAELVPAPFLATGSGVPSLALHAYLLALWLLSHVLTDPPASVL